MIRALLTNENRVREVLGISDNLAGEYLAPSLREAQDTALRLILGDALLDKVEGLVADGTIDAPENAAYKALLDDSPLFYVLAYTTGVGICQRVTFKVANAGVVKTPDEKVEVADQPDMAKTQAFYQSKADSYTFALDRWLLDKAATLPELTASECGRVRSHLRSAASCGVFLGGAMGKIIRNW